MSDKRKVSTDALETLGTIIGPEQKRDAIHLAVEPVIAGQLLAPGDHITVVNGVASRVRRGTGLGIVDPFLNADVEEGQRFWFVMYPRMVHSLRHVWAHPAFPDEPVIEPAVLVNGVDPNVGLDPDLQAGSRGMSMEEVTKQYPDVVKKAQAEVIVRKWCDSNYDGLTYEDFIEVMRTGSVDLGRDDSATLEDDYIRVYGRDAHGAIPDEIWEHVEIILGRPITNRPQFFSCSC